MVLMAERPNKFSNPKNPNLNGSSNSNSLNSSDFDQPNFTETKPHAPNSPNVVHLSLLNYFRNKFALGEDWIHPVTGQRFSHSRVKECLAYYRKNNRKNYKALWLLWISNATTSYIADNLNISASTLRRRWDAAINVILLLLLYPELTCEEMALYDLDW